MGERERYCQVLGVNIDAHPGEIRRAYLQAVKKWHPDIQPPERKEYACKMLQRINDAYTYLTEHTECKYVREPVCRQREQSGLEQFFSKLFDF